jgi:DNA modification methylase
MELMGGVMLERKLDITYIKLDLLTGWKKNPRINDEAAQKLVKLISEHGFIDPIIASPDNIIRAGHTRAKAAHLMGMEYVPVIYVKFKSEKQAEAFSISDNKAGEYAEWDFNKLVNILLEMDTGEFDMDLTGFTTDEIENLITEYGDQEVKDEEDFNLDEELAAVENPISQAGDIWLLGKHKVMCGDATSLEAITKLMGEEQADMIFTDPPYNVDYEGTDGQKIINDKQSDLNFKKFLTDAFNNVFAISKVGAPIYIFHADSEGINFREAMKEAGWNQTQTLIWVKNALVMGRQDYQWKHEPILYGWKPGAAHKWYGFRDKTTVYEDEPDIDSLKKSELKVLCLELLQELQTTVIREDKPRKNDLHPTMKPLPLIRQYLQNSSRRKEIIVDTFLGSGSTLIAGEQLERTVYGMEMDTKYCDVIINRYIKFREGSTAGVRLLRNGIETHYNDVEK